MITHFTHCNSRRLYSSSETKRLDKNYWRESMKYSVKRAVVERWMGEYLAVVPWKSDCWLSGLIESFANGAIIINGGPTGTPGVLVAFKARKRRWPIVTTSFSTRSFFNLPVTSKKLKLWPSGSGGVGSALPRDKAGLFRRARRKRRDDPGLPANWNPLPPLPPPPSPRPAAFTATFVTKARYI